jgi:hypothetical protein
MAAAAGAVAYTGGPVALPATQSALKQLEAGRRLEQFIAPSGRARTVARLNIARLDVDVVTSTDGTVGGAGGDALSNDGGVLQARVVVDSQTGLAVLVDAPSDLKWKQMKQDGLPWVK